MSRTPIATIVGLLFMAVYVTLAIGLPDMLPRPHWSVEALYWCAAGLLWVIPVRWLLLWAAGKR